MNDKKYITEDEFKLAFMVAKNHLQDWPNCVFVIEKYVEQLKETIEQDRNTLAGNLYGTKTYE